MATYINNSLILLRRTKSNYFLMYYKLINNLLHRPLVHKSPKNNFEVTTDAIDSFTDQLVLKKSIKWELITVSKKKVNMQQKVKQPSYENLNDDELKTIQMAGKQNSEHVNDIINACIKHRTTLSYNTFLKLLSICGQTGNSIAIINLLDLGLEIEIINQGKRDELKQYLAEAVWIEGKIPEAILIFNELFQVYPSSRKNLSILLCDLILRPVKTRTEAILVQIIQFLEEINFKYNEITPLATLWQECFLSEWFSDQETALELLKRNKSLREHLIVKYNLLCLNALQSNKVEVVQRLFEIFLMHKMTLQCTQLLQLLFDYHCWKEDFRQCAEIIKWSTSSSIPLRAEQHKRYLHLFINKYTTISSSKISTINVQSFKFKF